MAGVWQESFKRQLDVRVVALIESHKAQYFLYVAMQIAATAFAVQSDVSSLISVTSLSAVANQWLCVGHPYADCDRALRPAILVFDSSILL